MNEKKQTDDNQIEKYLDRNSELSSIYSKGHKSCSPKHLDKLIKNIARDEATPQDTSRNKHNNWFIPTSIAAMLLVSLFLIIKPKHNDFKDQVAATDATRNTQAFSTEQQDTKSKQNIQQEKVTPLITKNTPEKEATKTKEFELPSQLQQLLQNTNASTPNQLPPDEILKTWTQAQWEKQIKTLQIEKKDELSKKYIKKFYYFNPNKKLILSNNIK